MSLIKQAWVLPGIGALVTLAEQLPTSLAAKSGKPLTWLMKEERPLRKLITQPLKLSTFSNSINSIRQGYTTDSTKLHAAVIDGHLGQIMNYGLGAVEDQMKQKGLMGGMMRKVINDTIDFKGRFVVPKVEHYLKFGKKIDNVIQPLAKRNLTLYGGVAGGAIGLDQKEDGKLSKKNMLKGMVGGATLGFGLKSGINKVKRISQPIADLHDTYFKNDYWKDQLHRANSMPYRPIGLIGAHTFTAPLEDRVKRINRFEKMSDWLNKPRHIFKQKEK